MRFKVPGSVIELSFAVVLNAELPMTSNLLSSGIITLVKFEDIAKENLPILVISLPSSTVVIVRFWLFQGCFN